MSARRPRILVVEDEDLARERLLRLIGERQAFELVAACRNGNEALLALEGEQVDIALLDIEMPGPDGMQLLRRIGQAESPPLVVFITAHPRFAVDAFAGEAVDYVLKPFDGERLDKALRVAQERLQAREALEITERIRRVIDAAGAPASAAEDGDDTVSGCLVVRERGRLHLVRNQQIDWIEADGRYCVLHCAGSRHRINGPLAELGARLRSERFVQVNRSALVNVDRIHELQEMCKGDLTAIMKGGAEVAVSRRFRARVLRRLGGHHA